jgi:hypothetical protein
MSLEEVKGKSLSELVNGTVIITLLTVVIYTINLTYLGSFYDYFGLSVVDMNLNVLQVLSSDTFLVLLVIGVSYFINYKSHETVEKLIKRSATGAFATFLFFVFLLVILTALGVGKLAAWYYTWDEYRDVVLVNAGHTVTGYRFLCINGDRIYVFKASGFTVRTTSYKLSDVPEFTIGR